MFIIFINDLPDNLKTSSCKIFADDTKITGLANTDKEVNALQADLNSLHLWCLEWKLKFNVDKCHILHMGPKNYNHYYHIGGRLVTPVSEEKDLTIIMSKDM